MKQVTKLLAIFFVIAAFALVPLSHNPVGHWRISYTNGTVEYVDFYKDNTFKSFSMDGKVTHQGSYKLNDDVMSINDKEGCGDTYWGTYKLTYYGEDSVLNTVMEDSCSGRKMAVDGATLKRLPKK